MECEALATRPLRTGSGYLYGLRKLGQKCVVSSGCQTECSSWLAAPVMCKLLPLCPDPALVQERCLRCARLVRRLRHVHALGGSVLIQWHLSLCLLQMSPTVACEGQLYMMDVGMCRLILGKLAAWTCIDGKVSIAQP